MEPLAIQKSKQKVNEASGMQMREKLRYQATFHCTQAATLHARTQNCLTADSLQFVFLLQEYPTQQHKLRI